MAPKSIPKVSIRQVKAARALLAWSQSQLATAADVSIPTIKRLEAQEGLLGGRDETGSKIRQALEASGIVFIEENGGGSAARLAIADAGSLVPHDVAGAEILEQHEHVHRVSHGVERAAEVDSDVVTVPPALAELDIGGEKVGIEASDADASAAERPPQIDEVAKVATEWLEEAAHGRDSMRKAWKTGWKEISASKWKTAARECDIEAEEVDVGADTGR